MKLSVAGMLRVWREKKGSEATFLCLAEGLESLKWRDTILYLLDLFSDRKQADRESSRVEESKEPGVPRLGTGLLHLIVSEWSCKLAERN